jgi:hypothetical protein
MKLENMQAKATHRAKLAIESRAMMMVVASS